MGAARCRGGGSRDGLIARDRDIRSGTSPGPIALRPAAVILPITGPDFNRQGKARAFEGKFEQARSALSADVGDDEISPGIEKIGEAIAAGAQMRIAEADGCSVTSDQDGPGGILDELGLGEIQLEEPDHSLAGNSVRPLGESNRDQPAFMDVVQDCRAGQRGQSSDLARRVERLGQEPLISAAEPRVNRRGPCQLLWAYLLSGTITIRPNLSTSSLGPPAKVSPQEDKTASTRASRGAGRTHPHEMSAGGEQSAQGRANRPFRRPTEAISIPSFCPPGRRASLAPILARPRPRVAGVSAAGSARGRRSRWPSRPSRSPSRRGRRSTRRPPPPAVLQSGRRSRARGPQGSR